MKSAIIFDLDGTLWDARRALVLAWNSSLKEMGLKDSVTVERLTPCLGLPLEEIADRLFTDYDKEKKKEIIEYCCGKQIGYLRKYGGELYGGLKDTLEELKKHYDLFIVSNCKSGYIESFLYAHKMEGIFKDTEDNGRTGLGKAENIRLVMERNGIEQAVYVGDTKMDAEAAKRAEIPFIFAAYGFGGAEKPWKVINEPTELIEAMREIENGKN